MTTFHCRSCKKEVDLTERAHICKPVQNHGRMVQMVAVYAPKFGKVNRPYVKRFGSRPASKVARALRKKEGEG